MVDDLDPLVPVDDKPDGRGGLYGSEEEDVVGGTPLRGDVAVTSVIAEGGEEVRSTSVGGCWTSTTGEGN